MTTVEGSILTPAGWVEGQITLDGRRIHAIEGKPVKDPRPPYILPGFIDLHVHGGDGVDYRGSEDDIRRFIRFHARHGTVAIAPTTATAPIDLLDRALSTIETIRQNRRSDEPTVLGAHLEGPFINPRKLGAQMNVPRDGDVALARHWASLCRLVVATVAPEIPGGLAVAEALASLGCRVQIGHSLATADEARFALASGFSGFTHLFNAMSGTDHRAPGVAACALAHGAHAEIICDLIHVHPAMIRAACRAIPQLYAITDATAYAGFPDGEYTMDDRRIIKKDSRITLADGTLAGSAATMIDCFRNLNAIGLSLAEASDMCSRRAADYLGVSDLGRLAPGAHASLIVLDSALALRSVIIEGETVTTS